MGKKVLQVVNGAYRCTVEEQDDPVVWISHAMKGAGADLHVLLQGNAVNYAVKGQDASGLTLGGRPQSQPPRIDEDVLKLIGKGVDVYVVEDDVAERGLERSDLVAGIKPLSRSGLAKLYGSYDQIWNW
jgi:sulfur relay (sulfurtransferase) DsrF/TusC family protein